MYKQLDNLKVIFLHPHILAKYPVYMNRQILDLSILIKRHLGIYSKVDNSKLEREWTEWIIKRSNMLFCVEYLKRLSNVKVNLTDKMHTSFPEIMEILAERKIEFAKDEIDEDESIMSMPSVFTPEFKTFMYYTSGRIDWDDIQFSVFMKKLMLDNFLYFLNHHYDKIRWRNDDDC